MIDLPGGAGHHPGFAMQQVAMKFEQIRALIGEDLAAVNETIRRRLASDVVLIDQISRHIIHSGGKRLRPMLVLLCARACDYKGNQHIPAAAIIEFIHTATLLHDDVVDASTLRRGSQTANSLWGNQASVLVGDFLYSRSFQMMVNIGSMRVMEVLADATNTIAEGEVLQLINCHEPETTEEQYLKVIYRKTAKLFEAGGQISAILADQSHSIEQALTSYGTNLGTAFQLIDDVLDYSASPAETGKNLGDDLAEGKPTLPLIYAMRKGTRAQREMIAEAIETGGLDRLKEITAAVESTGAIHYTAQLARARAEAALDALTELPESIYKDGLNALTEFAVERTH